MIIKLLLPLLRETQTTAAVFGGQCQIKKIWTLKNSHNNWHYCFHSTPARPKVPINAPATCKKHKTPHQKPWTSNSAHTKYLYIDKRPYPTAISKFTSPIHDWKLLVAYFKCHLWKGNASIRFGWGNSFQHFTCYTSVHFKGDIAYTWC